MAASLFGNRRKQSGRPSADRMARILAGPEGVRPEITTGWAERVARPLIMRVMGFSGKFQSKDAKENLRERLMRAGFPGNLQTEQWLSFKFLLLGLGPVAMMLLTYGVMRFFPTLVKGTQAMAAYLMAGAIGGMVGYMGPDLYINKLVKKRQKEILLSLPDMIDLLAVSVEAGLGFDAAVARVGDRFRGALGEEFQRVRQEVQVGRPRAEALREMARRCEVPDLSSFVTSLIQAEQLGVAMGNILRVQSEQMRQRRSQRAREQAQKAPVKMMIPLILFIFPTLFIVIMGPAAIKGAQALKESGIF